MKLREALAVLESGKRMRKKQWPKDCYIEMLSSGYIMAGGGIDDDLKAILNSILVYILDDCWEEYIPEA